MHGANWIRVTISIVSFIVSVQNASAQDIPRVITPLKVELSPNGVNLSSGKAAIDMPTISIPADPRLTLNGMANVSSYVVARSNAPADTAPTNYAVHYGGRQSVAIKCTTSCESISGDGSKINPSLTFQRGGSGEKYYFTVKSLDFVDQANYRTKIFYASGVEYPDGQIIRYTYDQYIVPGDWTGVVNLRPVLLVSNAGYSLSVTYKSNVGGGADWQSIASAKIFKTSNPNIALSKLDFGTNGSITDLLGRVFNCSGCSTELFSDIERTAAILTLPGDAVPVKSFAPLLNNSMLIGSVTRDGVQWTYNYQNQQYTPELSGYAYSNVIVSSAIGTSESYKIVKTLSIKGSIQNLVTEYNDQLNRVTKYRYDEYFRTVGVTLPDLNEISLGYDAHGNVTSKVMKGKPGSGLADVTEAAYVDSVNCTGIACYRPVWHRDQLNQQTDFVYNAQGQLTEQTDPADAVGIRRKTYIEYAQQNTGDGLISRRAVVRRCGTGAACGTSLEQRTEYDYWANTFLPSAERFVDVAAGVTLQTLYTYDDAGRLLSIDGPLPGTADTKFFRYDALGRKTWEIGVADAAGLRVATRHEYRQSDDKIISVETGTLSDAQSTALNLFERSEWAYDTRRNPIRSIKSSSGTPYDVIDASFDDNGQKICETVRMNLAALPTSTATAACSLGVSGGNGPDRITKSVYDAANQLAQTRKAVGTSLEQAYTTYSYTANGKQEYVVDAKGNRAKLTYDGFDRQVGWYFPSPSGPGAFNASTQATALATAGAASMTDYEAYGYDANGNRTSLRKRDGRTIAYGYDALNRMTSKTYPSGGARAVYYSYDLRGSQTAARFDSPSGVDAVTSAWDGFGRQISSTTAMSGTSRTLAYQYDANNNRTRITYPDNQFVNYYRDGLGRLYYADLNAATPLFYLPYDPVGRVTNLYRLNQSAGNWTFGTGFSYDGISRVQNYAHTFTGGGGNVSTTFTYNAASQIISRTRNNEDYRFNGFTNVNRGYVPNGLNQYGSVAGTNFGYDANGNLTFDGVNSYGYDIENRLVTATTGTTLAYDPLGRLWQTYAPTTGTTRFLYDGDALVAEYDGAGSMLKRYVHGAAEGQDDSLVEYVGSSTSSPRYLFADHQGSIIAIADANGNRIHVNGYDEYGIPNGSTGGTANTGRFQYTGQTWIPELRMYHYKARIYSPTLGRFLQTDPIGYDDQINLYAYVANDPLNATDPDGKRILIHGTDEYRARVLKEIRTLQSRPTGRVLVNDQVRNSNIVNIRSTAEGPSDEKGVNRTVAHDAGRATDGTGSGSDIYYDPKSTGGVDINGSRQRPSFVGLGHELGHSESNMKGTNPGGSAPQTPGTTPPREQNAVGRENSIRNEHSLPARTTYFPPPNCQPKPNGCTP